MEDNSMQQRQGRGFSFHLFFYKEQAGNIFPYYEADKVHEAKPRHSGAVQTIH